MSSNIIEPFVNNNLEQLIINTIIPSYFPSLNKIDLEFISKLLIRLINIMAVLFEFYGREEIIYYQLTQNDYQDIKWLLTHLLPYINPDGNINKLSSFEELFTKKYKNVDINKKEPGYVYSNIQYNRCIRTEENYQELSFDKKYLEHNFYLLVDTLKTMSHKMFVNWLDIIPYSLQSIEKTDLYNNTNEKFTNNTFSNWDPYQDIKLELSEKQAINNIYNKSKSLDINDIYNSISNDFFEQIKQIKWLIYDIQIDYQNFPIIPSLLVLEQLFNLNSFEDSWNLLSIEKQNEFINNLNQLKKNIKNKTSAIIYKEVTISYSSLYLMMRGFLIQFQIRYKNIETALQEGYKKIEFNKEGKPILIEELDDEDDDTLIVETDLNYNLNTLSAKHTYEFIIDSISKLKHTWYSLYLLSPDKKKIRTLDASNSDYKYEFTFYNSKLNEKVKKDITITPKNIYNWCKSLIHYKKIASDSSIQLPIYWKSLTNNHQKLIINRLNDTGKISSFKDKTFWGVIGRKRLETIKNGYRIDSKITNEEINSIIFITIKNLMAKFIMENLIMKGVLTQFVPNRQVTNKNIIGDNKIAPILGKSIFSRSSDNAIWNSSYHYLTKLPYKYMDRFSAEPEGQSNKEGYNIFEYYSKYDDGYTAGALNWIAQIGFCHKFIHNRVSFITGATGVGKSTQVPNLFLYYLMAVGYKSNGKVACTAPRQAPTEENAEYVSEKLGVPVSHYNRPKKEPTENFYIQIQSKARKHMLNANIPVLKYITDGSLILEISNPTIQKVVKEVDETLDKTDFYKNENIYDVIIIDEAHEHNQNMDMLLTLLKLPVLLNNSVKLVILSATMDEDEPRYRRFFRDINDNRKFPLDSWIENHSLDRINIDRRYHISPPGFGTRYKIEEHYLPNADPLQVTLDIVRKNPTGDILVFQIGISDIAKFIEKINPLLPSDTIALPFHGQVKNREFIQKISTNKKVLRISKTDNFDSDIDPTVGTNSYNRVIIVATNVAEASITIPTLKFVVDTGTQKNNVYDYKKRGEILKDNGISESSRLQRKGRVGRKSSGTAYFLYPKGNMQNNKTCYIMSTADISLLIYSKLRKLVKEKPLLANNYDPNAPNNKLYVNKIKLKMIIEQYFIEKEIYYQYYGNKDHYDYQNYKPMKEYYQTGYSKETLIDADGSFYLIHPDELIIDRNICGKVIKSRNKDDLEVNKYIMKSKKMESFVDLLKDYLYLDNDNNKTLLGTIITQLIEKLEIIHSMSRIMVYSIIFGCENEMTKILALFEAGGFSSRFDIKNFGIQNDKKTDITKLSNLSNDKTSDVLILFNAINRIEKLFELQKFNGDLLSPYYINKVLEKNKKYNKGVKYYQELLDKNIKSDKIDRDDRKTYDDFNKELENVCLDEFKSKIGIIGNWFNQYGLNKFIAPAYFFNLIKFRKLFRINIDNNIRKTLGTLKILKIESLPINKKIIYTLLFAYPFNIYKKINGSNYYLSAYNPSIINMYEIGSFAQFKYIPKTMIDSIYTNNYLLTLNLNIEFGTIEMLTYIKEEDMYILSNIYNSYNVDKKVINKDEIVEYTQKMLNPKKYNITPKKSVDSAIRKINITADEIIKDIRKNDKNSNKDVINILRKIEVS